MPTPRSFKWATNLKKKEAVFGVAMADADLTEWYAPTAVDFAKIEKSYRTNEDEINGFAGPTESEIESKQGAVSRRFQASVEVIAGLLALQLGNVSSSGAADPWTHSIRWPSLCNLNPPSFSFVEMLDCVGATATFKGYKGVTVDSITVETTGRAFVELTANLRFDGNESNKAAFTPPATIQVVKKLIGAHRTLKYGAAGTEDLTSILRAFRFTVSSGLVVPDSSTSEGGVQEFQFGDKRPSLEVSFTIKGDKSHAVYAASEADTLQKLDFLLNPGVTPERSIRLNMESTKCEATVKPEGSETQIDVTVTGLFNATNFGGPGHFTARTGNATYLVGSP